MFKLIVEKELREIINSTKFAFTFGTCAILILLTFYVGANNYHVSRSQYEAAISEDIKQMEKNTNWFMVTHRIFLPPQPLAVLVTGISNDIGRNISIQGRGELQAEDSRFNDDPIYAVFRFLDLEFLFQIILSLFAILFAYNAINGEKELGTLRLSFANSVPRSRYIFGKLIGSFLSLALPLLIPILIGCALLPMLGITLNTGEWIKLSLIILTGFLYFGVFLTLSIFISALTKSSSSSFMLLLVIWIVIVLIIPRASILLAGRAVNVPSVDEIMTQKSKFRLSLWEEDRKVMKSWKPKNEEDFAKGFSSFMQKIAEERDKKIQEFSQKLDEDRYNRQMEQERLAFSFAQISPAASFSFIAANFAGTSLNLKQNYLDQAKEYQKTFAAFQKQKTGGMTGGGGVMIVRISSDKDKKETTIDTKELPEFKFISPRFDELLKTSLFDIFLLMLFNILFFFGGFFAFLRYDLR